MSVGEMGAEGEWNRAAIGVGRGQIESIKGADPHGIEKHRIGLLNPKHSVLEENQWNVFQSKHI